ncbi:hypothetical protein BKA66DRAFT_448014 [Pyrenochaeta sp. MPI-SDFR-AT-0127]|nr:hypothetical protein BKA66DRAFT_448014 [Pyrenochaeta sp. MPI-SDFR-AT-0127]
MRGLDWLRIESYARYAIDGINHCPSRDCEATFADQGTWKKYRYEMGHDQPEPGLGFEGTHELELLYFEGIPKDEKFAIQARKQWIGKEYQELQQMKNQLKHDRGEAWTEQRRVFGGNSLHN